MNQLKHNKKFQRVAKSFWQNFYILFSQECEGTFEYKVSLLLKEYEGLSSEDFIKLWKAMGEHSSDPLVIKVWKEMRRQLNI